MKFLREYGGLSRNQFGALFRSKVGTVYEWENGRCVPRLSKLLNIAHYFGVSLDCLLDGKAMYDNALERMLGGEAEMSGSVRRSSESRFVARYHALPAQYRERLAGYLDALCLEAGV